ncbi:flagellar hook-basal body complex protein [Lignipirellula cremea]|uniref:Flagellar hook protein FlgE n=1 Tax=Lignipirellula cremea TaxID=2528010 RepID=A0A518DPM7_9BACT|nr:flagellar hook-basal body complex protein [Lignipirellula cremea]QDU93784.1 Flagellar hook protein FlgE [Lignipirellula cremea]
MGLASALSTALTGLTAAESTIDVVGNNLANAQTVGFKASSAVFATQFLQTQSIGAAPSANNGGLNPKQVGLGALVADIRPDFTPGTIEPSSSPTDLAIQGSGFFQVQASTGETLFTRNGIFDTNSQNQLVNVNGDRVLGYGIDDEFQIQRTSLTPLEIPLGSAAVAAATKNVYLEGTLTPTGDVADTAEVVQSAILGDGATPRADATATSIAVASRPNEGGIVVSHTEGAGTHAEGDVFKYRFTFTDASGTESTPSDPITVTVPVGDAAANNAIQLSPLPTTATYSSVNIYRTAAGGDDFFQLDTAAVGATYIDDNSVALSATPLDETVVTGNYSYLVTYYRNGDPESRPSVLLGPENVLNGRIQLKDLPTPPVPGPTDLYPDYDEVRIYRNLSTDPNSFYLVDTVAPGGDYTDSKTDAEISNLATFGNKKIDLDGPKINANTRLVDVVRRDGFAFEPQFQEGVLEFDGRKGERALESKEFIVTADSTVQDLIEFMNDSLGIQTAIDDPNHPIPNSLNTISGETGTLPPGAVVTNGQIRVVSNNGVDSAVGLSLSSFTLTTTTGEVSNPNLSFGVIQEAKGQSAVADFIAYDSLGIPLNLRVTTVLESRTGSATTYRWFADSGDNDPASGSDVSVGTGLVTFDGEGGFLSSTNTTIAVDRRNIPSSSPLEFKLDFSGVSGLSSEKASLAATRQDGSGSGSLSSFTIGDDGVIRGVFTNGVSRDLGQIQLARFANPSGLVQRGLNLYAQGVNSGLPVQGGPGENGIGSVVSGAVELSNTDIGRNLIDLVLATTQYRGNSRVISTSQQLFDELLNIRR